MAFEERTIWQSDNFKTFEYQTNQQIPIKPRKDQLNNINVPTKVHKKYITFDFIFRAPSPSESALSASEAFEDARSEPDEAMRKEFDNAIRKEFFEAENDFIYQR